jgi:beta-barrel assembly-enhancing protease
MGIHHKDDKTMKRRDFLQWTGSSLLLVGCSTTSEHRHREGDNTGQVAALTVDEEKKLGAEALPELLKEYPAHSNSYVQSYLNDVGRQIVASNGLAGNPYDYEFIMVQSEQVNAFALPAGKVFVTTGLMKMTESEAELAGVIGHEVGHVQARHAAERMHVAKQEQGKSLLYGLGGLLLGGAAGLGLAQLLCKQADERARRECQQKATLYGGLAGAGGGLLVQKFSFMANSREDEMEADRIGFRTSYKANYHRDHIGRFYQKLYELEKKHAGSQPQALKFVADALSTHPTGSIRIQQMQELEHSVAIQGTVITTAGYDKTKTLI